MGTGESLWSESLIISTHIIDWWRRPSPALNVCQTATSPHVFSLRLPSVGFRLYILRTPLFLHADLASPRTAPPLLTIFIFYSFHNTRFSIMATSPLQSSPSLSSNAHFSTYYTNGHLPAKPRSSDVSSVFRPDKAYPASIASTPEVQINGKPNGKPRQSRPSTSSGSTHTHDDTAWGSHFWVTLVDPQASCLYWSNIYGFNSGLLCSTDPGLFFRMPGDGTSLMGPSSWELCVRTYADISSIPSSWGHCHADYRPARMASGGRLATNPVAVSHTIITQRLARPYGKSPMVLSYH
jgi:hypothetical protein